MVSPAIEQLSVFITPWMKPTCIHFAGQHCRKRTRGWNTQRRHRLADDVFAQHRSQRRAPVAAARERRSSRAFKLDIAPLAVTADHFAQKDRPAVAELRHELPELV